MGVGGWIPGGSDRPAPSSPRPSWTSHPGGAGARSSGGLSGASLYRGDGSPRTPGHLPSGPGPRVSRAPRLESRVRAKQQVRPPPGLPGCPLTPAGPPEAGVRAQRLELAAVGGPRRAPRPRAAPLQALGVDDVPEVGADGRRQKHEAERAGQRRRAGQRAQVHPHRRAATPPAARSSPRPQLARPGSGSQNWVLGTSIPPSAPGSAPQPLTCRLGLHRLPAQTPSRSKSPPQSTLAARRTLSLPLLNGSQTSHLSGPALPSHPSCSRLCRASAVPPSPAPRPHRPPPAQGVCPPTPFPQLWAQWTRSPLCAAPRHRETGRVVRGRRAVFPQRG